MFYSTVKIILIFRFYKTLALSGSTFAGSSCLKEENAMEGGNPKVGGLSPAGNKTTGFAVYGNVVTEHVKGRRGRPRLKDSERRKKLNLIYLTDEELAMLRHQHTGPAEDFGTFLRRKLLVNKTFVVPREIDPDVRNEIRNLLKLTGSINLIALKTKGDIEVSEEFRKTSSLIRSIAAAAKKSVDHAVELMEVAPSAVDQLNGLLQAVDYVEYGFSDFELLRAGLKEIILTLESLIKKFER
jgi:hypothetical protein